MTMHVDLDDHRCWILPLDVQSLWLRLPMRLHYIIPDKEAKDVFSASACKVSHPHGSEVVSLKNLPIFGPLSSVFPHAPPQHVESLRCIIFR
jgi:hypothetical protein